MEKKGARLFQQEAGTHEYDWNIVELESRRQLRQKVNELITLSNSDITTTSEIQQELLHGVASFGNQLATQLVRSLQCDDQHRRQQIVWLLTLLNDKTTIPLLQRMSLHKNLSRPIRLSASLALAGMGATEEVLNSPQRLRLYEIG